MKLGAFLKQRAWLGVLLILLIAGALRFYRIDAQSFWNDEGNSARLAERSVDLILAGARGDIHPPGYYLALHYWRALFGASEAALRALSVLFSLVTVLFAFLAGRLLFRGVITGLVAAAFVALNPFQIYYAQEARMYAMLAGWAMVAVWAMVAWWQPERRAGYLGVYVLAAVAGLYTHYAFPFVLLALNLGALLVWWTRRRQEAADQHLLAWLGAHLAVLVLYLPWLPVAWHQVTSWPAERAAFQWDTALLDVWRLLNLGQTVPTGVVTGGLISAGAFVFLSLLPPADEEETPPGEIPYTLRWTLVALLVLLPVGLILGLGLYKPAYQKFLLVSAAPLSILLARGVTGGWRIASGIGVWGEEEATWGSWGYRAVMLLLVALLGFDTVRSLNNLYFDETYARADYRAIARRIQADARPGDAVILNAPNQWEVFTYYYPDDRHVYPLARQRPLDEAANAAELEEIVAQHRRLFTIFWGDAESDPQRFIERWLEAHTYKAGETWYKDVRLAVYAVPSETLDPSELALDAPVRFGRHIYLEGYGVLTDELAAGDILQLSLLWRATDSLSQRYKVFVHLYDQAGQVVAQTDSEPGNGLRPTDTWTPGEQVTDRYGVLIPAETPPGDYRLSVGLYLIDDPDQRLTVTRSGELAGDRLDLADITVLP